MTSSAAGCYSDVDHYGFHSLEVFVPSMDVTIRPMFSGKSVSVEGRGHSKHLPDLGSGICPRAPLQFQLGGKLTREPKFVPYTIGLEVSLMPVIASSPALSLIDSLLAGNGWGGESQVWQALCSPPCTPLWGPGLGDAGEEGTGASLPIWCSGVSPMCGWR